MDFTYIKKLAEQGFLFSPTSMGMARSDRTGWHDIATNDPSALREWIADGLNLASIAKRGHGFIIDIDDIASAVAKGFDLAWLDGYFLVDSPSGGLHAHGLHAARTEAMGNLVVIYEVKGDKNSKKIVELASKNPYVRSPFPLQFEETSLLKPAHAFSFPFSIKLLISQIGRHLR
jgi:hypothetical protein